MGLPEKHQRPGGESEALTESFDGDENTIPRCSDCSRPLSAPASVARGLGPKCMAYKIQKARAHFQARLVELDREITEYDAEYAEFIFGLRKHNKRAGMRLIQGGAA